MVDYSNIFVNEGLSYTDYRKLVDKLLLEGKTTGADHSESMLHYSKLNVQRMSRADKTLMLTGGLKKKIDRLSGTFRLLVISEGWCGDAAQLVPLFDKIRQYAPHTFELKLVLRDQHLPLIDAHLTHGGRAIPVLLILDPQGALLAKWGPRPAVSQELLTGWKAESPDMFAVAEKLHLWYAKDKTLTAQEEIGQLLAKLAPQPGSS